MTIHSATPAAGPNAENSPNCDPVVLPGVDGCVPVLEVELAPGVPVIPAVVVDWGVVVALGDVGFVPPVPPVPAETLLPEPVTLDGIAGFVNVNLKD